MSAHAFVDPMFIKPIVLLRHLDLVREGGERPVTTLASGEHDGYWVAVESCTCGFLSWRSTFIEPEPEDRWCYCE